MLYALRDNVTIPLEKEKKDVIKTAKELCYSSNVIFMLENAKSGAELSRIMKDARLGKLA